MMKLRKKTMIIILLFLILVYLPRISYCLDISFDYTKEYELWSKYSDYQKYNTVVPEATSSILIKRSNEISAWCEDTWIKPREFIGVKNMLLWPKFDLRDVINFDIYNQGDGEECWAASTIVSMKSNLKYMKNIDEDFSVRHMNYATSNSFNDADQSILKYTRDIRVGGIPEIALSYLTNGQGAVSENKMPNDSNIEEMSISDIDIKPDYYVTDYVRIPGIFKKYDEDGTIEYFDSYGQKYTNEEVSIIRNQIKTHISEYGALIGVTASSYSSGYDDSVRIFKAKNYCCKDSSVKRDHVVSIVGWDDNYSKDNFPNSNKPNSDGAYIVMQSFGSDAFDNGYMYISYEDCLIESILFGITNSEKYDYDNIYQNDYYGANGTLKVNNCNLTYFATSFTRDINKDEELTKVSVTIPQDAFVEVWLNPKDSNTSMNNLIKVSNLLDLKSGYHTIDINPMKLTGSNYSIVIKMISKSSNTYFNIEFKLDDFFYSNVTNESNTNMISTDGKTWYYLDEIIKRKKATDPLKSADLCIKGFSVEK